MILPTSTEVLRQDLSATPCIDRVFVGRDYTFFISGELPGEFSADLLPDQLNQQRRKAKLNDLNFRINVVRVLPGKSGGTYFEAYARGPRLV